MKNITGSRAPGRVPPSADRRLGVADAEKFAYVTEWASAPGDGANTVVVTEMRGVANR